MQDLNRNFTPQPEQADMGKPDVMKHPARPEEPEAEETAKPEKPDRNEWAPVDLSKGTYKDPHLYGKSRASVARHLRQDLKSVSHNFAETNEIAKELAAKKGKGITRSEFRKIVKGMVEKGMPQSRARRYIKQFKAYK